MVLEQKIDSLLLVVSEGFNLSTAKPESTDGWRMDSGRGVKKLQTRRSGFEFG